MMAREIRSFDVRVEPGTPPQSPQYTDLSMPPRIVDRIDIRVPPGPAGLVGFAISSGGAPIIPYNPGEWIITDDEAMSWPLEGYIDSGGWQVIIYNLGNLPHTIQVRFLLRLTQDAADTAAPRLIADGALSSSPGPMAFAVPPPPAAAPPPNLGTGGAP